MSGSWRLRLHTALEEDEADSTARTAVKVFLVGAILASVSGAALETVHSLGVRYAVSFQTIEIGAVAIFALEYLLRLWVAPEHEPSKGSPAWRARLDYARSGFGIIDLLAFLPSCINLLVPIHPDWLRILRLLRLLKIGRFAPGLPLFAAVIRAEKRPLLAALLVMMVLLILESGIMYVLERNAQPQVFASIPHAMWWAIVTMATVGYGDIAPVTPLGKLFGGIVMIIGIAMFAVPAGILATGFALEIRKRDFVVTWHSVAKVPLFAGLDAARIAEIARLLKREVVPAKYAVVRRGEPADAMFFIMSGELEVDVQPTPRRMGRGQFFGEIALLTDTVRTATVTALSECELLVLDAADFRRLLEAHPDLKASVTRVAEQRLGSGGAGPTAGPAPAPDDSRRDP
jgi:voltage-gated potassium channel